MSLKDIDEQIKFYYDSDVDNLLEGFYIKVLSRSKFYRRLTGSFSSTILAGAARGMSKFIINGGKMELICWTKLSSKDIESIKIGNKKPKEVIEEFTLKNLKIKELEEELERDYIKALSWMIANGNLKIKIAVKKDDYGNYLPELKETQGEFHRKGGLLKDNQGNEICFSGSGNETLYGWKYNIEELHVFKSWNDKDKYRFQQQKNRMNKYWENKGEKIEVFDFPEAAKEKLINESPTEKEEIIKLNLERRYKRKQKKKNNSIISNDLSINPWPHQNKAINKLKENNFKGIFKMATGTGKTFTALFGLNEYIKKKGAGKKILVIVHRNALKDQWKKTLIKKLKDDNLIYTFPNNDTSDLKDIWERLGDDTNIFLITTIQSLDNLFKNVKSLPDFVIADEVHNYGTINYSNKINTNLANVKNRLGLSATPERFYDEEGTNRIFNYFGDIIYEYGIKDAQKDGVLADYNYYVNPVRLTQEEEEDFEYWTKKIKRDVAINLDDELWTDEGHDPMNELNTYNLIQRANIIKQSNNKFDALRNILLKWDDKIDQCIVYFNERKQLERGREVFDELNIDSYIIYHSYVNNEDQSLEIFKENDVRYVLSMKCLDEGIDIPSCDSLILLSCSKNPRKYVQRRGRVLRNTQDREKIVKIFDVVAFPNTPDPSYRSLVISYLARPWEFIDKALNINERNELETNMQEYGIDTNELNEIIEEW